ncbi:Calcineurin-like phosphoesterase, partial [Globisporangium splendens]
MVRAGAFAAALCCAVAPFATGATISATASSSSVKKILHFSDVHLNISASLDAADSAAFCFHYGRDAPVRLLESALTYAQQVLPNPDFFLYTGDHVAHGMFSDEYIAKALETNVKTIEKFYAPHGSKMLETTAIIGNADGNPDYYMEVTNPQKNANPSIQKISEIWSESLSQSDFEAFNRKGYLTYELDEKLLVLTLNTVPYSPSHLPDTSGIEDPFGQFAWLNATLTDLQKQGKFAYITGHIAPIVDSYGGNPQWHVPYINRYKSIVGKFPDVIKAQFFGHVHSVEFRIPPISSDATEFELVPLFVSGSISPLFGNNPSFMVWDYNASTYEVLDFTVYGTNISEVDQTLDWKPLFKASENYGLKALSRSDLTGFYQRVGADSSLLEAYYWNMKAQSYRAPPCTTDICHANTLCSMKWWSTKGEYLACVDGAKSVSKIVEASNKVNASPYNLAPLDVCVAILMTVLATVVGIAVVLAVLRGLRGSGVVKSPEERDREREGLFPML